MDSERFDRLARSLAGVSRRRLLAGLVASLVVPLEAAAKRGKGKGHKHRKDRQKDPRRLQAQQEDCWRAGACIPDEGSNVSQCDLEDSTAFAGLDCTRCNVSRANLRNVNATGANFTRANLSGSCLVDADFTGATFHPTNTNLYNAIFCRTIMPNGDINNSGCTSGTACCPTCNAGLGQSCANVGDRCCDGSICQGNICVCPGGLTNCAGVCVNTQTDPDNCGTCGNDCGVNIACALGACACDEVSKPCGAGCIPQTECCGGCVPGLTCCNGACSDTKTDKQNCDECGNICQGPFHCEDGGCFPDV